MEYKVDCVYPVPPPWWAPNADMKVVHHSAVKFHFDLMKCTLANPTVTYYMISLPNYFQRYHEFLTQYIQDYIVTSQEYMSYKTEHDNNIRHMISNPKNSINLIISLYKELCGEEPDMYMYVTPSSIADNIIYDYIMECLSMSAEEYYGVYVSLAFKMMQDPYIYASLHKHNKVPLNAFLQESVHNIRNKLKCRNFTKCKVVISKLFEIFPKFDVHCIVPSCLDVTRDSTYVPMEKIVQHPTFGVAKYIYRCCLQKEGYLCSTILRNWFKCYTEPIMIDGQELSINSITNKLLKLKNGEGIGDGVSSMYSEESDDDEMDIRDININVEVTDKIYMMIYTLMERNWEQRYTPVMGEVMDLFALSSNFEQCVKEYVIGSATSFMESKAYQEMLFTFNYKDLRQAFTPLEKDHWEDLKLFIEEHLMDVYYDNRMDEDEDYDYSDCYEETIDNFYCLCQIPQEVLSSI